MPTPEKAIRWYNGARAILLDTGTTPGEREAALKRMQELEAEHPSIAQDAAQPPPTTGGASMPTMLDEAACYEMLTGYLDKYRNWYESQSGLMRILAAGASRVLFGESQGFVEKIPDDGQWHRLLPRLAAEQHDFRDEDSTAVAVGGRLAEVAKCVTEGKMKVRLDAVGQIEVCRCSP